MTAGDLPVTTGNPDQGFEGYRFVGYNLYDALVLWDLSGAGDKAADIKPGLATEWHVDEGDSKRWIFTLREGVKWHDGCPFTADDVVWNFGYSGDDKAPQFNPAQFAQARAYLGTYAGVEKVDDRTVAFTTKVPDALFPYMMSFVMMVSPCRAKEVNNNWTEFALKPSGTGPYKFDKMVPHQRLEFVPNTDYWDKARVPKQARLVLVPMPEASTRTAALLSGQVDLDRGTITRRARAAEICRYANHHADLPAQLVVSAQLRQRSIHRQARPPGGQLCPQPRGRKGFAERYDARRLRDSAAVTSLLRQSRSVQIRSQRRRRRC